MKLPKHLTLKEWITTAIEQLENRSSGKPLALDLKLRVNFICIHYPGVFMDRCVSRIYKIPSVRQ